MNIVTIGNGWFPHSPGGLERYFYGLAQTLSEGGDQVHLFTTGKPEPAAINQHAQGIGDPKTSLPRRLLTARRSFTAHWPEAVDVVNLHFALYGWPALRSMRAEVPAVFHFHGPWAEESQREGGNALSVLGKRWVERQVFDRCQRFITLSHAFKQLLHRSYGVPEESIHVIPGGIDTTFFKPAATRRAAREKLNWPQDRFIAFTPRRLVNRMGLSDLVEAVGQLKHRHPHLWLAVAGRGPLAQPLQQQIDRLDLAQQVKLLGFVSDEELVWAYQAADLTVLPSLTLEGFGLALAESLACGTPAIATPVGGMPEVLAPLAPDLVMSAIGSAAIASTLDEVLGGGLALPTAEQCRHYAQAQFAWPTIAKRVRQVFSGVDAPLPALPRMTL